MTMALQNVPTFKQEKIKRKKIAALLYGLDRTYHLKNIDSKGWIGEKDNG